MAGRPEAEILAEYDLTTEQLRAVFRYAAWLASPRGSSGPGPPLKSALTLRKSMT